MRWIVILIYIVFAATAQDGSNFTMDNFYEEIMKMTEDEACELVMYPFVEDSKIYLNITWNIFNHPTVAHGIEVFNGLTDFEYFTDDVYMHETNNVILPEPAHPFNFVPGVSYNITFKGTRCNETYHFPECVETVCNCGKMATDIKLDARQTSTEEYELIWQRQGEYPFENITFRLIHNSSSYSILPINLPGEIYSSENGSAEVSIDSSFLSGDDVEIEGFFINEKLCHTVASVRLRRDVSAGMISTSELLTFLYIFIVATVIIALMYLAFLRNTRKTDKISGMIPMTGRRAEARNILYVSHIIDNLEFPIEKLHIVKELNGGAFGVVYLAKAIDLHGIPGCTYVAAKMQRDGATHEEQEDFLSEINTMKKISAHPNVVQLFGYCTKGLRKVLIMEYVPCGDLKNYLLDLRESWYSMQNNADPVFAQNGDCSYINFDGSQCSSTTERPSVSTVSDTVSEERSPLMENFKYTLDRVLDHTELQNFALQIAKGMAHLEKIPITHRDLAARNVLINEYKVLKISDFGMSRTGPYVNRKRSLVPFRWMAIESIEDSLYDSKSDVWSFGIVLWEIGTLAAFPYKEIADQALVHRLLQGHRLKRPEICTDFLYDLMLKCWEHEPDKRPTFEKLVMLLDIKKTRIYVDFSQLNPTYMFPPSTEENSN